VEEKLKSLDSLQLQLIKKLNYDEYYVLYLVLYSTQDQFSLLPMTYLLLTVDCMLLTCKVKGRAVLPYIPVTGEGGSETQ